MGVEGEGRVENTGRYMYMYRGGLVMSTWKRCRVN